MIKYNYNEACIATWEELEPLRDTESGAYFIYEDPELTKRFLSIPKLIEKGIRPFITIKTVVDDTTYYYVGKAVTASFLPQDPGPDYVAVEFSAGVGTVYGYDDGILAQPD